LPGQKMHTERSGKRFTLPERARVIAHAITRLCGKNRLHP
jgi:hypothetical protein